jgi:hypothetical protein
LKISKNLGWKITVWAHGTLLVKGLNKKKLKKVLMLQRNEAKRYFSINEPKQNDNFFGTETETENRNEINIFQQRTPGLNTLEIFFFSKIQDGAHNQYDVFLAFFSRSFRIRQRLQTEFFLHILEEQTPKKLLPKINLKWPLNSRWLPKLNWILKTTNQKKNLGLYQLSKYPIFILKKILKNARWRPYSTWNFFLLLF